MHRRPAHLMMCLTADSDHIIHPQSVRVDILASQEWYTIRDVRFSASQRRLPTSDLSGYVFDTTEPPRARDSGILMRISCPLIGFVEEPGRTQRDQSPATTHPEG